MRKGGGAEKGFPVAPGGEGRRKTKKRRCPGQNGFRANFCRESRGSVAASSPLSPALPPVLVQSREHTGSTISTPTISTTAIIINAVMTMPWASRAEGKAPRSAGAAARLRASPARLRFPRPGCGSPAQRAPRAAPAPGREGSGESNPGHSDGTRRVAYLELLRVQVC